VKTNSAWRKIQGEGKNQKGEKDHGDAFRRRKIKTNSWYDGGGERGKVSKSRSTMQKHHDGMGIKRRGSEKILPYVKSRGPRNRQGEK